MLVWGTINIVTIIQISMIFIRSCIFIYFIITEVTTFLTVAFSWSISIGEFFMEFIMIFCYCHIAFAHSNPSKKYQRIAINNTTTYFQHNSTSFFNCWTNFITNVVILFSLFQSMVAFKILDSNSSFQLVRTALTTTYLLTSGSSMLSSGIVSITSQVSWFCHKNSGTWNHFSTLFFWLIFSHLDAKCTGFSAVFT